MFKKKGNIKSASIGFIVGALFFSGVSYAAGSNVFKIMQNGIDKTPIAEDLRPLVQNGRVYVPVRTIANLLDVPIGYDNASKTVTLGEKIVGTHVKNVASYSGNIESITNPKAVTINGDVYKAPILLISHGKEKGSFKLSLNGKYKNLSFSLGMDDSSHDEASMILTFKDENERIIDQQQIGYGGLIEDIDIDVTNVLQLTVETDTRISRTVIGRNEHYVAFINPVLQ